MTKLQEPLEIGVWNTSRTLRFTTSKAVADWAKEQHQAWHSESEPSDAHLKSAWQSQTNTFATLSNSANDLEVQLKDSAADPTAIQNQFLAANRKTFDRIRQGSVITTDHPSFDSIKSLASKDPNAASLLLLACTSNGRPTLQNLLNSNAFPLDSLIRHALTLHRHDSESESLIADRNQVHRLMSDLQLEIEGARNANENWQGKFKKTNDAAIEAQTDRTGEWTGTLTSVTEQWTNALKAYDEKMALAAPTTYWRKRAITSMRTAIAFGISFAALIAFALYQFQTHAIPYLATVTKPGVPILSAVLPVIIPSFAAVWILRIVGRLLSENIQLMQDAKERETMVMTFLALMHDEVRGTTLVTDDDRLLILHSLFRPSALSATDDSPPVNWFDILSRKFGGSNQK